MKTRHLGRALVALAAAAATIGLMSAPASANDAEIQSGTSSLYSADSELFHSQDLADEGAAIECQAPVTTFNVAATTHTWTFSSVSRTSVNLGGIHFTVTLTISLNGTSSSTGTSTGGGGATLSLAPNSSTSCTTFLSPCVISITGLTLSGTHNVSSTGAVASNTATVSGDNGDHGDFGFEVDVPETGFVCASLGGLDDGSATINNVVIHATT